MEIDITKEKGRFSTFLAEENNTNIVFSGIFGIGKTYFIHNFFDNQDNYVPVYLSPVQYSVSSNEDIFEYIKVDILFELIKREVEFEKTNFSFSECTQMYIMENIDSLIVSLLKKAEKLKYGTNVISSFFKLKTKLEKYKNVLNTDQYKEAITFLSSNKEKIGSIYEDNAITELIRGLVESLKGEDKQIILVIDDLDRIDPEHIFRILNILSVHENFYGCKEENKFGFDKTILICDANNIKKIYHTKYGIDVDFNGYIDKFYSKRIYHFDNIPQIIDQISLLLGTIQSDRADIESPSTVTHTACKVILSALIKNNRLNIRDLLKKESIILNNKRRIIIDGFSVNVTASPCLVIMDFIASMFCTLVDMSEAINSLNENDIVVEEPEHFLSTFIILADFEKNRFKSSANNYLGINYSIGNVNQSGMAFIKIKDYPTFWNEIRNISMKEIIVKSFANYRKYFV